MAWEQHYGVRWSDISTTGLKLVWLLVIKEKDVLH